MAVQRRALVLQEVAHCLTRLTEARTTHDCVDALAGFLQALPLAWYALDLFEEDHTRRRIFSHRCSRGFSPFVTRLGFLTKPDGVYHGTFADSTLMLVRVGRLNGPNRCLICGVGLEKVSPLNDGVVLACVGALMHQGLSRIWSVDGQNLREAMLESQMVEDEDLVVLIDGQGRIVDMAPPGRPCPPELARHLAQGRRLERGMQTETITTETGHRLRLRWRSISSRGPLESRFGIVCASRCSTAPVAVADQLKLYSLSKRESQIAELVFTGTTNQRIAETLFISPDTVKTHCRRIFDKLGISRRTDFLRVMSERGHQVES